MASSGRRDGSIDQEATTGEANIGTRVPDVGAASSPSGGFVPLALMPPSQGKRAVA